LNTLFNLDSNLIACGWYVKSKTNTFFTIILYCMLVNYSPLNDLITLIIIGQGREKVLPVPPLLACPWTGRQPDALFGSGSATRPLNCPSFFYTFEGDDFKLFCSWPDLVINSGYFLQFCYMFATDIFSHTFVFI